MALPRAGRQGLRAPDLLGELLRQLVEVLVLAGDLRGRAGVHALAQRPDLALQANGRAQDFMLLGLQAGGVRRRIQATRTRALAQGHRHGFHELRHALSVDHGGHGRVRKKRASWREQEEQQRRTQRGRFAQRAAEPVDLRAQWQHLH
jgi:hypothetical protein